MLSKMYRNVAPILCVLAFSGLCSMSGTITPKNTAAIIDNMVTLSKSIQTIELDMLMTERFGKEYKKSKSKFKVAYSPFSVYVKQEYPTKGLEMLFVEGENHNKAIVQPAAFPWKSINLSPLSNLMRQDFHHSIFKSGYSFIIEVMEHLEVKYRSEYGDLLKYDGLVKYDGNICHKIIFTNPHFVLNSYIVKEGENLEGISRELKVSDYMIKELNPSLNSFTKLKTSEVLKVPNDYAKSITLYIHKEKSLLMGIKIYDDKGLWEEYTYRNVKINPHFSPETFSKENETYNF